MLNRTLQLAQWAERLGWLGFRMTRYKNRSPARYRIARRDMARFRRSLSQHDRKIVTAKLNAGLVKALLENRAFAYGPRGIIKISLPNAGLRCVRIPLKGLAS